ncbi:hypothetical protein Lal_00031402 [Lupinus albus]|nr:hypothetical protein Lal_00031402 [Lupinus albus]
MRAQWLEIHIRLGVLEIYKITSDSGSWKVICEHSVDRDSHQARSPGKVPSVVVMVMIESHAQSSSSAAIPTNQMIMDELVSLRGYITTRMDAFDTQNQQIHYELHRLSSRLSNMDVDEDSSEFES